MIVLLILLLLVPALISVLIYEKLKGYELTIFKRFALWISFVFLINFISYAAVWIRGWNYISWTLDKASDLNSVSFCLKYMAMSLVSAITFPFVLSLIRIGNSK